MLSPFDDYPVHQTARPIAHPVDGNLNRYDRYFFNGYDPDGDVYFAAAMGLYPNRRVIDAALSVVTAGEQISVFASGRAPADPGVTEVGPFRLTVEEPMRRLRFDLGDNDHGLAASLVFGARTAAVEEPHFHIVDPPRTVMDYTRFTQWGEWSGTLDVDGRTLELDRSRYRGTRDRSWGVRRVGEPEGGAPSSRPPQFHWLWAPLNFDDVCVHVDTQQDRVGQAWHSFGAVTPVLAGPAEPVVGPESRIDPMADARIDVEWQPGTRWMREARMRLTPRPDHTGIVADETVIDLEPLRRFQMKGLGYFHPTRAHGLWQGELSVTGDRWRLDGDDATDPARVENFHVQTLVRATMGDRVGTGILEQLVLGPHEPSGFTGFTDLAGS